MLGMEEHKMLHNADLDLDMPSTETISLSSRLTNTSIESY